MKQTLARQTQGRSASMAIDPYIRALIMEVAKRNEPAATPGLGLDFRGMSQPQPLAGGYPLFGPGY